MTGMTMADYAKLENAAMRANCDAKYRKTNSVKIGIIRDHLNGKSPLTCEEIALGTGLGFRVVAAIIQSVPGIVRTNRGRKYQYSVAP